ncbi:MAG: 3-phosphoserine/phosphohydroxythreonine transaminase [Candidatus Aureabacteria bacterium]|nr:3-phosphoserine/phosphohydroxythreonine transaminase [Candidatus Auribacterota bacterium]
MGKRVFNFYAGPATLPLKALKEAKREMLDFRGTGMSVCEISHRSKDFQAVIDEATALIRELYAVPPGYHVLWLGGGASTQFFHVPWNLGLEGKPMAYIHTGSWAKEAIKEAKFFGEVKVLASSEDANFNYVPRAFTMDPNAAYLHITANETIGGIEWIEFPDPGNVPLVVDASSDFLSHPVDWSKIGLLYAGAQKNLGPAGVTVVIVREDMVARARAKKLPTMVSYGTHVDKGSMHNTQKKAKALYRLIDSSNGFYRGFARPDSRSRMNITFRLVTEQLEEKCVAEAKARGLIGLKGHRSVGGMRASFYNAMPLKGVKALTAFLAEFQKANA